MQRGGARVGGMDPAGAGGGVVEPGREGCSQQGAGELPLWLFLSPCRRRLLETLDVGTALSEGSTKLNHVARAPPRSTAPYPPSVYARPRGPGCGLRGGFKNINISLQNLYNKIFIILLRY